LGRAVDADTGHPLVSPRKSGDTISPGNSPENLILHSFHAL